MVLNKKGNNPLLAAGIMTKALPWLGHEKLRKYIVIPILINVVLYSCALVLGYLFVADLIDRLIPDWLHWLTWLLWPLFFISFLIGGFFTFTLVANLIAAPFYGKLAATVLDIIAEDAVIIQEPAWRQVLKAEFIRAGYLGGRALLILIVSFIPGINLLAPFLWAVFGAWAAALEYLAYPLENAGIVFTEQRQLIKTIRLGALSFGGLAALGLTIPVINIIAAPVAVIGATIYIHEISMESKPEPES